MGDRAQLVIGTPCKKCGSAKPPDTQCSHCGGYGMRHGACGDPETCSSCGASGIEWPPRCPDCSAYRSMVGWV